MHLKQRNVFIAHASRNCSTGSLKDKSHYTAIVFDLSISFFFIFDIDHHIIVVDIAACNLGIATQVLAHDTSRIVVCHATHT